jgi:diacylglycerol kinase
MSISIAVLNASDASTSPYARDTKDVAAGAVLIAAITSATIGVLVFAPYFF